MSNAASLFLPGSNLTNLITLHGEHASGAAFLSRMWAAAIVAVVITVVVLLAAFRRELGLAAAQVDERAPARLGVGIVAVVLSTALVLTLSAPALPVLAVGGAAVLADRVGLARIHEIVDARVLNNLPAAVLLTPHAPAHPRALLIGLNLGPNLAVTGSLSAYLWLRVARSLDARPSVRVYSSVGVVLVPLSLGAALGALWLVAPGRL